VQFAYGNWATTGPVQVAGVQAALSDNPALIVTKTIAINTKAPPFCRNGFLILSLTIFFF
jgi:hypothetical protein